MGAGSLCAGGVTVSFGDPFVEGTTTTFGGFAEGGSIIAASGSYTVEDAEESSFFNPIPGENGSSSATSGLVGVGWGAAAGYQYCTVTTVCLN